MVLVHMTARPRQPYPAERLKWCLYIYTHSVLSAGTERQLRAAALDWWAVHGVRIPAFCVHGFLVASLI
jgi:hypothetical protein